MKERPILFSAPMVRALLAGTKTQTRRVVHPHHLAQINLTRGAAVAYWSEPMPYGRPGDRLWVRETFGFSGSGYIPDIHFRATNPEAPILGRWHPSIHMRRIDSRITLEITSVRVERLQEISEADAAAEGLTFSAKARRSDGCMGIYELRMPDGKLNFNDNARDLFRTLWEQINGPCSWDANPWVWVIEFRRLP